MQTNCKLNLIKWINREFLIRLFAHTAVTRIEAEASVYPGKVPLEYLSKSMYYLLSKLKSFPI